MIRRTRWITPLVVLSTLVAGAACGSRRIQPVAPEAPVVLEARNRSIFEVTVYGIPSPGAMAIRIGTAMSFTTTVIEVPRSARRGGESLVLRLHAIGSNRWWTSPELVLSSGMVACLDIYATPSGDLSQSAFYSAFASDSQPPSGGKKPLSCALMANAEPAVHR